MGLLDNFGGKLGGLLGEAAETAAPAIISAALAKTNLGDLQGLVNQLQQNGLGDQVKSWLGNGANMQITPEQLRAALSSEQVKQIAAHFGVPADKALEALSAALPQAVDQASPNGKLQ
ncbi:MAG TPA: YidB family protein [Pseudolabrys sp.]|jgi:uncharacterized protein YidB (DUF937 family)|nr:YidB family protein [Pseudolabrys sp.]